MTNAAGRAVRECDAAESVSALTAAAVQQLAAVKGARTDAVLVLAVAVQRVYPKVIVIQIFFWVFLYFLVNHILKRVDTRLSFSYTS